METERKPMGETDMNSPITGTKERGKFFSLNRQEAQLILQTYIKRSLSNHEKRTVEKKEKRHGIAQRSASDHTRFTFRKKENKISVTTNELQELQVDKKDMAKPSKSETVEQNQQDTSTTVANSKDAKKSWFKNFLDHLFKKGENPSEQTVTVVSSVTPKADGHLTQNAKKVSIKKNSFRRTLSFKKNGSEEGTKLKRPTHLPLKRSSIRMISSVTQREKHGIEECYYHQMSAEIEQLVSENDGARKSSLTELKNGETEIDQFVRDNDGARKTSLTEELKNGETDDIIKKIVSILQKEGDVYDRKIKQDPSLSSFFRNISYNSFKQLADVYVDKEVKKRGSDDTPEDIKFAFSIHFTKQIAGIATHPVNRIMGFGNKYLEDTFTWLSHSTDNLNKTEKEGCISPD